MENDQVRSSSLTLNVRTFAVLLRTDISLGGFCTIVAMSMVREWCVQRKLEREDEISFGRCTKYVSSMLHNIREDPRLHVTGHLFQIPCFSRTQSKTLAWSLEPSRSHVTEAEFSC